MSYALRTLRKLLKESRAILRSTETHIRNAGKAHKPSECFCVSRRRSAKRCIKQLERAIVVLEADRDGAYA